MQDSLDNTYGNSFQVLEPYMLYGDRTDLNRLPEMQKERVVRDLEYFHGLYPGQMKRLQEYVISACDHLDYKNSPMYDEYPDRLMINQVCDSVCRQIEQDGVFSVEELPDMTKEEGGAEDENSDDNFTEEMEAENAVESYETSGEDSDISEMNIQEFEEASWSMQQAGPGAGMGSQPVGPLQGPAWGPGPRPPQPPGPGPRPPQPCWAPLAPPWCW